MVLLRGEIQNMEDKMSQKGMTVFAILFLLIVQMLSACDGGGGGNEPASCASPIAVTPGTWCITIQDTDNTCSQPLNSTPSTAEFSQSGNILSATSQYGASFSGTVCGNNAVMTGEGVSVDITFSDSGHATGTTTWENSGCSGTDTFVAVAGNCDGGGGTAGLTITGFSPVSGPVGTTVTITGTNFSSPAADNTVKFNDVFATVTNATDTSITASVPAGATTGAITVTAGGQTATSTTIFTVAAGGGGTGESESNDDHSSAQNITADTVINGTTSGNQNAGTSDDDWYKIAPAVTGNYTIQITFENSGDLDLYLFDSSALTLLGLSTEAAYGGTETITHMFINNQTYYIWVSPWDCTATTNYTLTVEKQ